MANPYGFARAYQTQSVLTASPGQLVLMLFDGALRFLSQAQDSFASDESNPKRVEQINGSLVKAQNILIELRATLNLEAGGDYASNLDRLYEYYIRRLFEANVKKRVEPVIEVERLLRQVRDGWAEMLRKEEASRYENTRGVA